MTADEARDAITRHLERMDRTEGLFVGNKGGSLGNRVVMEIGSASAHRKPVYALAPRHDPFLRPLVSAVVRMAELLQVVHPCIKSWCRSQVA
jgi:hypothetical protein